MESIRLLQQIIQRKKSIIRKRKSTERIFFILPHHLRIRTAPGEPALLIRKPRRKRSKRHRLQKIAPMLIPEHRRFRVSYSRPQRPQIIFARRTAHNQRIQLLVVFLRVCAHNQGSHTVSHQNKRKIRVLLLCPLRDKKQILHKSYAACAVHKSEVLLRLHTLSVPAVIMNHTHHTVFRHIFHKRQIPLLILTHSMAELQKCRPLHALLRLHYKSVKNQPIHLRLNRKFSPH